MSVSNRRDKGAAMMQKVYAGIVPRPLKACAKC
jgi:hypothetical protein